MASDGSRTRTPLGSATEYAALGFAVVAECPPTCNCSHPGKRPWDPTTGRHMDGWQQRGVPTGEELDAWLAAPGASHLNIGCRCGPGCLGSDGLIGADVDGPRGVADLAAHLGITSGMPQAAVTEFREAGMFGPNLRSAAYLTQSAGLRVLWRAPAGVKLRATGGDRGHDGLGLYWQGKQVVLPPSVGPEGAYRWLPGHSPWQVGFTRAPASVLAAMSGKLRTAAQASVVLLPRAAYLAATGDRGPDQAGRLVDAGWLPYDLDLLREGVPQGQRSEAVRRLELQMLAADWTLEQVVAALGLPACASSRRTSAKAGSVWGRPWVPTTRVRAWPAALAHRAKRARYPRLRGWGRPVLSPQTAVPIPAALLRRALPGRPQVQNRARPARAARPTTTGAGCPAPGTRRWRCARRATRASRARCRGSRCRRWPSAAKSCRSCTTAGSSGTARRRSAGGAERREHALDPAHGQRQGRLIPPHGNGGCGYVASARCRCGAPRSTDACRTRGQTPGRSPGGGRRAPSRRPGQPT